MNQGNFSEYKNFIYQCYEKYKIFVGNQDLPNFEIIFHDYLIEHMQYSMQLITNELYNQKYILKVNNMIFNIMGSKQIESIAFHEFTHLTDSLFFRSEDYNIYSDLMITFSEAHASQIELMKTFKFSSLSDNKRTLLSSKLSMFKENITLYKFIDDERKLCIGKLNNAITNIDKNSFITDLRTMSYYIGHLWFVKKYCSPYDKVLDEIPEIFLNPFLDLQSSIVTKNVNDIIAGYNVIESIYATLTIQHRCRELYSKEELSEEDIKKITHLNYRQMIDNLIKKPNL